MPIVPTEPSLLDRFIELEDAVRRREAGCGSSTAGDPPSVAPPEPEPSPADTTAASSRPIILPGACKKKADGSLRFPNGTPWQFFAGTTAEPAATNQLVAVTMQAGSTATPARVRLDTKLRWVAPGGEPPPTPRAGSLLMKLPPGWWPVHDVTVGVRVLEGAGAGAWGLGHVQIGSAKGHVVFHPKKAGLKPTMIDLTPVVFDAGGGAGGQGDGSNDPTGGGCGQTWQDDGDNANTPEPIVAAGELAGGGGAGVIGEWQALPLVSGFASGRAFYRTEPGCIRLTGQVVGSLSGNRINNAADIYTALANGRICAPDTFPRNSLIGGILPAVPITIAREVSGFDQNVPGFLVPGNDGSLNVVGTGNPVRMLAIGGVSWGVSSSG